MGVYHLMGLGRSPGTVIGPLTYLAHRYRRWNADDQRFFARSGEAHQRAAGEKVGDVQAIVLFTTREVLNGEVLALNYVDNPPARIAEGPVRDPGPMKEVLRHLLRREWPAISGGRREGALFWCEIDRRNIRNTYERIVRVVAALAGTGGQGKEMWANLTGGNNVINVALELAAMLSGDVARLYYVQAENQAAEKCVRFTAENGYWVELPVMPLALGRLSRTIVSLLSELGPAALDELYSILRNDYWDLSRGLTSAEVLRAEYLAPLWKQGLIAEEKGSYVVGPQWELIRPYQEILEQARRAALSVEQLAERENWIEKEELDLK
ncbi:MAG: hypothetical protein RML36_04005 [Anaerolineae bacterium]|nr:hypothetical protein [Anaerolineae bacterium]MDW8098634.1 hypothetical protein [Anaerolineae bacterium]